MLETKIKNYIKDYKGDIAIYIKDLETKEEIKINEQIVFPSASTIKLVIMAELLDRVNNKDISLDEQINIGDYNKVGGDGILKELETKVSLSYKDILTLMIILSDNYATNILIDVLGFENINKQAEKLGLSNTKLKRKMMDQEAVKNGKENMTTAEDMKHILELIYNKEYISKEMSVLANDIMLRQQVNGLNIYLPEEIKIAHKTGDLDKLEHDVGIVYLDNKDYIICVLTKNLDSNIEGKKIISNVSKIVYEDMKE